MKKKGLMAPEMDCCFDIIPSVDPKENATNLKNAMDNWNLGPLEGSPDPKANSDYWTMMADIWLIDELEARRQVCANCEYYDNTPEQMEAMESVPYDKFDETGGGRGYCHKLDFICHSLRVCQAWERKDYEKEED